MPLSGPEDLQKKASPPGEIGALISAMHFAAQKHRWQRRKDNATPYINHPIAVAELLAGIGQVTDIPVLQAALLHDTVEDTDATPEGIEREFGKHVREMVMEVTDDMSLSKGERHRLQIKNAPHLSTGAKLIRIADKACNFWDISDDQPAGWSLQSKRGFMLWGIDVVNLCRGVNAPLEAYFDQIAAERRTLIGI